MQYLEEYRDGNTFDVGFEDRSRRIFVNSIGWYTMEDMKGQVSLSKNRKDGRRDYLLCFVEQGTVHAVIGDQSFDVEEGVFLYRPNRMQRYYSINTTGPLTLHWIHFTGYGVNDVLQGCQMEDRSYFPVGKSMELVSLFKKLMTEMRMKAVAYENLTASLVECILALIARQSQDKNVAKTEWMDKRIQETLNYIHYNYQNDMDVHELARMVNLSVSRFSSLFNEYVHVFPKAYITQYRISKSCEMLRNTDFTISQIAYFTGFHDPLYFSRIFKKYKNMSPSLYAEQSKKNIF